MAPNLRSTISSSSGFQIYAKSVKNFSILNLKTRTCDKSAFFSWPIDGFLIISLTALSRSFLVKHLLIDWRFGERWFWDTLLDADLASNIMNWQWVAGSGADASPCFRIFNPLLQAQKFDPKVQYIKEWVPELRNVNDKAILEMDHLFEYTKGIYASHCEARRCT